MRAVSSTRSSSISVIGLLKREPEEPAGRQCEEVRQRADPRETCPPEHLFGHEPFEGAQVELDCLGRASHVVDAQDDVVLVTTQVGEDPRVLRHEWLVRAGTAEGGLLAARGEAAGPAEE